jgi:hypothetical protein
MQDKTKAVLVELTNKEFDVLLELSEQLSISKSRVLVNALRYYQLSLDQKKALGSNFLHKSS